MTNFTVEVTTRPVQDGDFGPYYRIIDAVPGTVLLEDPEEPTLIVPVTASSPGKAAQFVEGLTTLVNITVIAGEIRPAEDDDEYAIDVPETPVVDALHQWVEDRGSFAAHLTDDGQLVLA